MCRTFVWTDVGKCAIIDGMKVGTKNPHTPEWNKKISDGVKRQHAEGRVRIVGFSDESREKAYKILRGRKLTKEHRLKLRLAKLGKKHTLEHRLANSFAHKGKTPINVLRGDFKGEKHPNWKGGITPEIIKIRNSPKIRDWRLAIFLRDNYTCKFCGIRSGNGKKVILHADHIKEFAQYPELRFEVSNGRTLCRDCHYKRHRKFAYV